MKTSELTGRALDWAVARAEGLTLDFHHSTDWSQGGPIIEREMISIGPSESGEDWIAMVRYELHRDDAYWCGLTPLVAAMRCYVASKLGDEVEIPNELMENQA